MSNIINGTTLVEKESRSIGDVPIGGIVPWAKTLAGVPNLAEGWVECDGSVLVDSQSSLNGQTIPDLNGDNRFLRGNSTSGGVGGAEPTTHRHVMETTTDTSSASTGDNVGWETSGSSTNSMNTFGAGAGSWEKIQGRTTLVAGSTLPPYYEIVWIMRVR